MQASSLRVVGSKIAIVLVLASHTSLLKFFYAPVFSTVLVLFARA